ncbi:hypothetical protein EGW08_017902 [Elysia chlorotica]|uniref:Myb/SANT-like DNA-binding domain-containing protein n=1 Tax=Elysia chlorotica TaxID=188477 RepID=A0A3S0ZSR2_ELYCH|nr:hypothetical protein EGW08_017902 [Elysia chlorotica]
MGASLRAVAGISQKLDCKASFSFAYDTFGESLVVTKCFLVHNHPTDEHTYGQQHKQKKFTYGEIHTKTSNMEKSEKNIKARKKNYTDEETRVLLTEMSLERNILIGPLSGPNNNMRRRNEVWSAIVDKINAMAGLGRTIDEVRKKWKDLRASAIKYKSEAKRTGGGPPPRPPPFLELIELIMGEESTLGSGIEVLGTESYIFKGDTKEEMEQYEVVLADQDQERASQMLPIVLEIKSSADTDGDEPEFEPKAKRARVPKVMPAPSNGELTNKWLESEIANNATIIKLNELEIEKAHLHKRLIDIPNAAYCAGDKVQYGYRNS